MTPAFQTSAGWQTRRFVLVASFVFVLQLLLVSVLSARRVAFPTESAVGPTPALVWLPAPDPLLEEMPDAATLAVVNRRSFSGPLWIGCARERLMAGSPAEGPLAIDGVSSIKPLFPRLLPGQPSPAEFGLPTLVPQLTAPLSASRTLLADASVLRVDGEVRSRRVVQSGALPPWTNIEILAPTAVQILVDRSGGILSATLQPPGSGLTPADQLALQRARSLRFEPATGQDGHLQWGTLEFVWHTVASAAMVLPPTPSQP